MRPYISASVLLRISCIKAGDGGFGSKVNKSGCNIGSGGKIIWSTKKLGDAWQIAICGAIHACDLRFVLDLDCSHNLLQVWLAHIYFPRSNTWTRLWGFKLKKFDLIKPFQKRFLPYEDGKIPEMFYRVRECGFNRTELTIFLFSLWFTVKHTWELLSKLASLL